MNKTILFDFVVDKENNRINVERSFDGPVDLVWDAWTNPEILDQWWAPKPYQAVTKSMDFREGGRWHYVMRGPNGEEQWCLFDYDVIKPVEFFSGSDAFCDEHGQPNDTKPKVRWEYTFIEKEDETIVSMRLDFKSLEDLETIIKLGFREGFTAGMENLDQYIAAQFMLRKTNKAKTGNKTRVSTYLNFAGRAEEAFQLYKRVFKSEFINGIKRFGDLPRDPSQPAIADNVKKMILHIELPILNGFILMGSDAPKEMGFTVTSGNNVYIQLELESREEADRIFNELSADGKIEMPLQDMFWGAYFGSFTDKFGINWMLSVQNP